MMMMAIACFGSVRPQNPLIPWGLRDPHLTLCVIGPQCVCQMASESVERFNYDLIRIKNA